MNSEDDQARERVRRGSALLDGPLIGGQKIADTDSREKAEVHQLSALPRHPSRQSLTDLAQQGDREASPTVLRASPTLQAQASPALQWGPIAAPGVLRKGLSFPSNLQSPGFASTDSDRSQSPQSPGRPQRRRRPRCSAEEMADQMEAFPAIVPGKATGLAVSDYQSQQMRASPADMTQTSTPPVTSSHSDSFKQRRDSFYTEGPILSPDSRRLVMDEGKGGAERVVLSVNVNGGPCGPAELPRRPSLSSVNSPRHSRSCSPSFNSDTDLAENARAMSSSPLNFESPQPDTVPISRALLEELLGFFYEANSGTARYTDGDTVAPVPSSVVRPIYDCLSNIRNAVQEQSGSSGMPVVAQAPARAAPQPAQKELAHKGPHFATQLGRKNWAAEHPPSPTSSPTVGEAHARDQLAFHLESLQIPKGSGGNQSDRERRGTFTFDGPIKSALPADKDGPVKTRQDKESPEQDKHEPEVSPSKELRGEVATPGTMLKLTSRPSNDNLIRDGGRLSRSASIPASMSSMHKTTDLGRGMFEEKKKSTRRGSEYFDGPMIPQEDRGMETREMPKTAEAQEETI